MNLELLTSFRKELHKYPELSGREEKTSARIIEFLEEHAKPDEIHRNVGKTGVIAEYRGEEDGPTLMFRGEIDALPIHEINEFDHRSTVDDVGHECGHDGHTTIIAGLAMMLAEDRPKKGNVLVLFQPAEETGEGAAWMAATDIYKKLDPDMVFALHNLPGYPMHQVVLREGVFASASTGMIIKFKGHSSHAAEPQNGNSPALAITEVVQRVNSITKDEQENLENFCLITPIHFRLGEIAFGTTPGEGVAMFTLRSYRNVDMDHMKSVAEGIAKEVGDKYGLKIKIKYTESFPTTKSSDEGVSIVREVASGLDLDIIEAEEPFKWSEDFGVFTKETGGCFFGLGSGVDTPSLHNPDYDFPDELIETGAKLFNGIRKHILK